MGGSGCFAPPSLVGALLNALPMLSTLASSGAPRRQPTRAAIVGQLKSCHLQAPISDPGLKKSAGRQSQQRVWPGVAPLGVLCRRRQRRPTLRPLICLAYNMKTREAHAPGRKRVVHLSRRGLHERRSFKHKTARSGVGADGGDTKRGGRAPKTKSGRLSNWQLGIVVIGQASCFFSSMSESESIGNCKGCFSGPSPKLFFSEACC